MKKITFATALASVLTAGVLGLATPAMAEALPPAALAGRSCPAMSRLRLMQRRVTWAWMSAETDEPLDAYLCSSPSDILGGIKAPGLKLGPGAPITYFRGCVVDVADACHGASASFEVGQVSVDQLDV